MHAKDVLVSTMDLSLMVLQQYVSDLGDADLLVRPGPGCNHLAWQIGHLIVSEAGLLSGICPGLAAELPAGFSEKHGRDKTGSDDPSQFCTKQEYLDLFATVRAATKAALAKLPDERLGDPSPESLRNMFPTVASIFTLIGTHPMMHAGQFVVVRRQLGKPVLI